MPSGANMVGLIGPHWFMQCLSANAVVVISPKKVSVNVKKPNSAIDVVDLLNLANRYRRQRCNLPYVGYIGFYVECHCSDVFYH